MRAIKETPLLMKGPLVRATLDGTKTQTRRTSGLEFINNGMPGMWDKVETGFDKGVFGAWFRFDDCGINRDMFVKCPYGQAGDMIWVRETTYKILSPCNGMYLANYSVDDKPVIRFFADKKQIWQHWWYSKDSCPSIHMPRWASRINLEIVSIRVERLNDISTSDAEAEGIEGKSTPTGGDDYMTYWRNYGITEKEADGWPYFDDGKQVDSFKSLWESINGDGSWQANPWVWVIEYKVIEK
jgi:hypothetical protein